MSTRTGGIPINFLVRIGLMIFPSTCWIRIKIIKINKDFVLDELFFRFKEGASATSRLDGPIELIGTGESALIRSKVVENPKRAFRYRDFHSTGRLDDETYPAKIELRRIKPGASAPTSFYPKALL